MYISNEALRPFPLSPLNLKTRNVPPLLKWGHKKGGSDKGSWFRCQIQSQEISGLTVWDLLG